MRPPTPEEEKVYFALSGDVMKGSGNNCPVCGEPLLVVVKSVLGGKYRLLCLKEKTFTDQEFEFVPV